MAKRAAGANASRGRGARRRRRPEEAEAEILEAAERLLRRRPFRDLTVDLVMAQTGLSRPSFYQYFRDIHDLVTRLVQRLGADLYPMADRWFRGRGRGGSDLRHAFGGVAEEYARHGPVLRAIADASTQDPRLEQAYRGLIERFVIATAARIRAEARRGRIWKPLDAEGAANALVWMSERYLNEKLGRDRQASPRKVADTLSNVWLRVLYRRSV